MSSIDKGRLIGLLPGLQERRIVVVGDVFLDEYVVGRATRLSREAPIPVLEFERRFYLPGGAANPSSNVVALGGVARQVGVVGDDEAGLQLLQQLREAGIDATGLVTDPSRPTTTKTRIVARGTLRFPQQLARIDHLDRRPVGEDVEGALIAHLEALVPRLMRCWSPTTAQGWSVRPSWLPSWTWPADTTGRSLWIPRATSTSSTPLTWSSATTPRPRR